MLVSFAEAAAILDREDYGEVARANATFLLSNLQKTGCCFAPTRPANQS